MFIYLPYFAYILIEYTIYIYPTKIDIYLFNFPAFFFAYYINVNNVRLSLQRKRRLNADINSFCATRNKIKKQRRETLVYIIVLL